MMSFIEPIKYIVRMMHHSNSVVKYFCSATVIGYSTEYIKLISNHIKDKNGSSAQEV